MLEDSTVDWKEIRRKVKREEKIFVFIILGIIIVSIIDEVIAKSGYAFLFVLNYESVSLVVIQIQATVQTLSIALLALVSGKSDDSYLGMNYNYFLFNIRPYVFSQKKLVYELIALLIINVFFHMFRLYNIVIAVFIVACMLIYISVKEIYSAFMGQSSISTDLEIESYYRSFTIEEVSNTQTKEAFKQLCKGWQNDLGNQNSLEYEKYQSLFNSFLEKLLLSSETQLFIEKEVSELLKCFCKSSDISVKEKSLCFLENFYTQVWSVIVNHKEEVLQISQGTHILAESYNELLESIDDLSVPKIEKNISLASFMESVVLCNIWLGYDPKNNYELRCLSDFLLALGRKLKGTASFDGRYWGEIIEHLDIRITVWPDKYIENAIMESCKIKLHYAIMIIRIGKVDILKDSYFSRAVNHINYTRYKEEIKLYLKIQCYLYYLAFYEGLNCISEELRHVANSLLEETNNYFAYGAEWVERYESRYPETVFNELLVSEIWNELRTFELYPRNDDAKMLVMPDATSDFVIFLSMYLSNRYYHNRILHNIISEENAISLYMRYFQDEQIVERFSSFLKIIGCDKKPEIMLNEFQGILKEEIKKAQIAKAKNDYLLDKNTDFAHADLAHRIQDYLNEKFKPIISDEARKVSLIRVPILGINGFSNMSLENIINGQYDVIAQNLIYTLCDLLSKSNAVNHVKRNSCPDDESFFTFLKADGNDTIIGSKFSIRSSDYANREQLNDIISSKKSVLEGYTDRSLLIRENMLHIFIDDIRIGTHSGTLSEERNDIIFDSRTQSYLYEVTNNIPIEFNKDELLQYLHDRRKIVNIVLYISVHKEEGKIGNLLVTEN